MEENINETQEAAYETPYYEQGITQEQLDSIIVSEPVEAQAESEETQPENEQPSDEVEESVQPESSEGGDMFVVDGQEFSKEEIAAWKTDSENKTEWQKSNTTKSQDLSAARKALEAEIDRWKALRDDSDLMDAVKDYLGDEAENNPLFNTEIEAAEEPTESEKPDRVTELEGELHEMKVKMKVAEDIQSLVHSHPELRDNEDAIAEVINTMVDRNLPTLEDAFLIANAQATEKSAFNKAKKAVEEAHEAKKIPVQKGGTKGSRAKAIPKMKDYREIRDYALENYDI